LETLENSTDHHLILQSVPGRNNWNLFLPPALADKYPNWDASIASYADAIMAIDVITLEGEGFPIKGFSDSVVDNVAEAGTDAGKGKEKDKGDKEEQQKEALDEENIDRNAHFFRFYEMYIELLDQEVKSARERKLISPPWNPSYPVIPNPSETGATQGSHRIINPRSLEVLKLFNRSYALMLQMLTFSWTTSLIGQAFRLGKVFNLGIDLMLGVMKPLGEYLCSSCPSGYHGYHAGPSFEIGEVHLGALPVGEVAQQFFEQELICLTEIAKALFGEDNKVFTCLTVITRKMSKSGKGLDYVPADAPPHVDPALS